MKKGFTLVEMLGIIVILSVVAIITYSGITTLNRKSKIKEFEDYKKTLYMAAETYLNINNIDKNNENCISVTTLLEQNLINNVVMNPDTNKEEYNASIISKKDNAGVLVFEYKDEICE